ncbi:PepSY domain-containing protein [Acinetobacter bereziniae]|uniref:PepSY domain-containing protein n=1 Tax=Acinetobacter bereziniae TaxID=106648 RepID=A0A8I1DHJ1_ACIBZ|nr:MULTISPECIES: PepSY-associated TM helix domain-containing protein [Acinetobacter]MEC8125672.1 PepSY-associated TM helix domain-containing protein [Pseudomonadota bacterium]MBJ8421555.1 PepSY domain-containing protein [Acinetobacter bereziniae]MBJ8451420.1 PepSY domain-containing protein [Acinetobacter bereziniae]MBJ8455824.1 PepSY domain-containing protein [Acinetobacter bereziniae]MBJ9948023.1 PepSY domain-containing protein [Acinetobacter bereziniae]
MRVDAKVEGPRQSMSWLHTWASLILGWLLYAIFLTGTLSFFQSEISVWMKPETHQSVPSSSQLQQTQVALNYLQKNYPDAGSWTIQLPNSRQTTTELNIRKQGEDLQARRGGERITIDSATGQVIEARDTRGGGFLYRFHFELYGVDRIWARWLVGLATMLMFVAIISGIITHKKIFKDFFTFRSGKGQRSWLDAHNATAVFALPFHIMITFSGLLLLMFMFMPWGINQVYEDRQEFFQEMRGGVQQNNTRNRTTENRNGTANTAQGQTGQAQQTAGNEQRSRGERRAKHQQEAGQPAALTDLAPIIANAQIQWKDNPIASIQIIAPNTTNASIELRALYAKSVIQRGVYPVLKFDGVTGKNISDDLQARNTSVPMGIYNVVTVLHEARGLDLTFRWLLFFSGVLGTLMVATGLILWCVKRAPQQQKQGYKSFGYRFVEVMNIAAVIGLPIACAAYFYANRFIPFEVEARLNWEIRAFFIAWLATLIYAAIRPHRQAWLELLMLATVTYALLPLINFMTGGQALWNSIANGQWMIASFDLMTWAIAILFFLSFYKVKKHKGLPVKKAKNVPATKEIAV